MDVQMPRETRAHGRAKLEQCTTAGMQEIERLRRQSRGAIVEDVESGGTRQICREQIWTCEACPKGAVQGRHTGCISVARGRTPEATGLHQPSRLSAGSI